MFYAFTFLYALFLQYILGRNEEKNLTFDEKLEKIIHIVLLHNMFYVLHNNIFPEEFVNSDFYKVFREVDFFISLLKVVKN
jgi:hypothetical protein